MTKTELIDLAVGCGWEYRRDSRELCKGRYYFNLNNLPRVVLKHFNGDKFVTFLGNLQSVLRTAWIIGPFTEGWFSLKANRFVK